MSRKVVGWFALMAALLGVSAGALQVARKTQESLETYRSPYGARSEPAPSATRPGLSPLAGRVVLVVIDGLRNDTSHQMPFLSSLRRQGAWTELRTREPSFSKPGYAVLLTGTWAEVSGVTLNAHSGPVATDHLLRRLKAAGLRSAVIGDEWWGELADGQIDYPYLYPDAETHSPTFDARVTEDALRSLATDQAAFTLVHLCAVDSAAHQSGGAASEAYLKAARDADDRLRRIAQALDFRTDALIVTADHGHLSRDTRGGGHGGGEPEVLTVPLVMVGRGIRPGRLEPGEVVDTVPTAAALLGVAAPLEARGRPRWDGLAVDETARAAWGIAQLAESVEFAKSFLGALEGKPAGEIDRVVATAAAAAGEAETLYAAGRFGEAAARSEEARRALFRDLDRRRSWRLLLSRLGRVPGGLALAAVLPLLLRVVASRRRLGAAIAVGLLFLALDALAYGFLLGYPWSLSALPGTEVADFLRLFGWPEYLALAVLTVPFLAAARRRRSAEAAWDGLAFAAGPYLALLWVVAVGFVVNGFRVERFLPHFPVGFLQLGALIQLAFLLPAAVLLPVGAVLVSRGRPAGRPQPGAGAAAAGEAETSPKQ
ncbi:MAG: alkaline phosphatase family protein [Bacillota bacterium]|nr:alkaline phosphatase family protein [Bacillota bacterium]